MRQQPPLGSRTWKPEEEDYLMEKWGQISVPAIAKKLNRTTNAVKVRAQRLGLGAVLMAGEYVTLNQLLLAVTGGSSSYGYKMKSWVENRGLPVHTKKVDRCSFRVVYIDEFWEWAERYRSFIDFSKMEPLALGEEPEWVVEQRKKDFEAYAIQRKDPWGEDEDSRLKMLLSKHRYSWAEISEMMHRSRGAIARRCRDLGIKDRPVSMELTGKRGTWTSEDFEILADGIRHGDSYAAIGKAVGRSEKCVRSKVYNDYLTENADKVREMLGDGAWGHGAPEMDVRHGFYISRTRHQVRRDLSALATVLRKRMNDLGYDPYWQRFMCMNWDDIGGCSAGCTDCDSCTAFRRIQPQYCARCGGTFYERKENRFCAACRTARKKQAQRHEPKIINCPSRGAKLGVRKERFMAEIKYIPVSKLWRHPDNPRKDLGDVTELAESIKVNGVLQNLTVVPLIGEITKKWDGESYRVIIGHRRLAAAKLAGLEELPCVVVEMSEREQLSTMLTENMQRSDLTVYEQAQGFQMMLDMGDTVEDIAEKSGFSATTVRRRVKLLELDKDKFKKSEERGVSLFEYMELDKLKSPERKNEMLDFIGTDNFKYKLKQAIDAEAADERRASWVERLSSFATQVTDRTGYKFARSFYVNSEVNVERPEDADTVEYFFIVETYYITLMTKDAPTTLTPEEEAKKREEQLNQERKNAAEKALSEATARAYELRADFVATVSAAAIKKRLVDIVALWAYAEYWDDTSWLTEEEIAQATGAETLAEDDEDGEDDAAFTLQAVTDAIGKTPEKALLRMIYARLGDGKSEGYFRSYWNSYTMKHEENEKLDRIYALLVKLGYEMSDDEKALQDGTHELFGEVTDE